MKQIVRHLESHRTAIAVILVCLVAFVLASKGITDEGVVSLNGDMPRYLMNGVFFFDYIADGMTTNVIRYTHDYFAQYPALSLGHHPVLLPLAEAPFFALFGVSVASGRVTMLAFLLFGVFYWFLLARSAYDDRVALLSSLLLVTSPLVVVHSRIVMSEIPALAALIVAAYYFHKYVETEEKKYLVIWAITFVMSCYGKQLTIFALPVFVLQLIFRRGWRSLFSGAVVVAFALVGVFLVPLVFLTLRYSPTNVAYTAGLSGSSGLSDWLSHAFYPFEALWSYQLHPIVILLSALGALGVVLRRDGRAVYFLLWIAGMYGLVVFIGLHDPRLSIYWIPAFCLFAALSPELFSNQKARLAVVALLAVLVGYRAVATYTLAVDHAAGYEEAAREVVEAAQGPTLLYSSSVDTGYFVFFVRKWDPGRNLIVLRANKMLATSFYKSFLEDRISGVEGIYEVLDDFGVCHIVLEDVGSPSRAMNLLREELERGNFVLRREIPIETRDYRLEGVSLRVYEYPSCGPPNPDALLDMDLPMIGDSIEVRLGDLLR